MAKFLTNLPDLPPIISWPFLIMNAPWLIPLLWDKVPIPPPAQVYFELEPPKPPKIGFVESKKRHVSYSKGKRF